MITLRLWRDNLFAAERLRIPYTLLDAKCDELNLPEMKIVGNIDKSRAIKASVDHFIKYGVNIDSGHYKVRQSRKVKDRFVLKIQLEARPDIQGHRFYNALDVIYTRRKWHGHGHVPNSDKLAWMGHTEVGRAIGEELMKLIHHKADTTNLGQLHQRITEVLDAKGEGYRVSREDGLGRPGTLPNSWDLDDEHLDWAHRVQALLAWAIDDTVESRITISQGE